MRLKALLGHGQDCDLFAHRVTDGERFAPGRETGWKSFKNSLRKTRQTAISKTGDSVLFLAEVQQAGIFEVKGFSDEELTLVLNIACPKILLPFAREVVAELVAKGGFPQLLINPINFEVLYAHRLQREKEQAGQKEPVESDAEGGPAEGATIN